MLNRHDTTQTSPACIRPLHREWPAEFDQLRTYWQARRKGQALPRRTTIEPRAISGLLHCAFIAERIAPGQVRFRVAGQTLTTLMGMEVRGMPLTAFLLPASRARLSLALVDLFDAPAVLRLRLDAPGRWLTPTLGADMMMLPLTSDLGDVSRVLGCLRPRAELPSRLATPCRFEIKSCETEHLAPVPARRDLTNKNGRPPLKAERPYLRLVT